MCLNNVLMNHKDRPAHEAASAKTRALETRALSRANGDLKFMAPGPFFNGLAIFHENL